MSIAGGDDLSQMSIRLRVAEIMAATVIAAIVRAGNPLILHELRRNVLGALNDVETTDDQIGLLACEEATDRLLDQIEQLARIA